jgi:hypothetical protein
MWTWTRAAKQAADLANAVLNTTEVNPWMLDFGAWIRSPNQDRQPERHRAANQTSTRTPLTSLRWMSTFMDPRGSWRISRPVGDTRADVMPEMQGRVASVDAACNQWAGVPVARAMGPTRNQLTADDGRLCWPSNQLGDRLTPGDMDISDAWYVADGLLHSTAQHRRSVMETTPRTIPDGRRHSDTADSYVDSDVVFDTSDAEADIHACWSIADGPTDDRSDTRNGYGWHDSSGRQRMG